MVQEAIDLSRGKKKRIALPTEDPSVRVLRERQIRELAELDEEENRRLKAAFRRSRGIASFRRSGESSGAPSVGTVGQRAFRRSRIPGSGQTP